MQANIEDQQYNDPEAVRDAYDHVCSTWNWFDEEDQQLWDFVRAGDSRAVRDWSEQFLPGGSMPECAHAKEDEDCSICQTSGFPLWFCLKIAEALEDLALAMDENTIGQED